jgi:hypothetical protein
MPAAEYQDALLKVSNHNHSIGSQDSNNRVLQRVLEFAWFRVLRGGCSSDWSPFSEWLVRTFRGVSGAVMPSEFPESRQSDLGRFTMAWQTLADRALSFPSQATS